MLTDVWFAVGRKIAAIVVKYCSGMEAATHFAISDFNSHFHTSLVHLKHRMMDIDGFVKKLLQESRIVCVGHCSSPPQIGQGHGSILFQSPNNYFQKICWLMDKQQVHRFDVRFYIFNWTDLIWKALLQRITIHLNRWSKVWMFYFRREGLFFLFFLDKQAWNISWNVEIVIQIKGSVNNHSSCVYPGKWSWKREAQQPAFPLWPAPRIMGN